MNPAPVEDDKELDKLLFRFQTDTFFIKMYGSKKFVDKKWKIVLDKPDRYDDIREAAKKDLLAWRNKACRAARQEAIASYKKVLKEEARLRSNGAKDE